MIMERFLILLTFSSTVLLLSDAEQTEKDPFDVSIFFPDSRPRETDAYVCASISLKNVDASGELYIKAFTPIADMSSVHHMLLYGCTTPGKVVEKMWNCDVMAKSRSRHPDNNLPVAGICSGGGSPRILYAWARNAPMLQLPEGVAFKVGGNTKIQSLVLQYHSGNHNSSAGGQHKTTQDAANTVGGTRRHSIMTDDLVDVGLILQVTRKPTPKLAGVYFIGTSGSIPAHKQVHLEAACMLKENKEIFPFAFRTHSHTLGKVISGYRVRKNKDQRFDWTLIGKKDPQLPQMFYPVESDKSLSVRPGDILAARCTMESDRTWTTYIGATTADEMCNFYIMYYVNGGHLLEYDTCYTMGSADNFWRKSSFGLDNFPRDASTLD